MVSVSLHLPIAVETIVGGVRAGELAHQRVIVAGVEIRQPAPAGGLRILALAGEPQRRVHATVGAGGGAASRRVLLADEAPQGIMDPLLQRMPSVSCSGCWLTQTSGPDLL